MSGLVDASHARKARVLLVEDDERFAEVLREYLSAHELELEHEPEGAAAVRRILSRPPDAVILDLMLPGMDGLEICRRVRSRFGGVVLMLTASQSDADHVAGLASGADDFVTKPIEPRVLLARLQHQLGRHGWARPEETGQNVLVAGPLRIDVPLRSATVFGTPLPLTEMELDLLTLLVRRAGKVVTRDELYEAVMGVAYDGLDRGVDVHVSRIRRKLEGSPVRSSIRAIRGSGYVFVTA